MKGQTYVHASTLWLSGQHFQKLKLIVLLRKINYEMLGQILLTIMFVHFVRQHGTDMFLFAQNDCVQIRSHS
jgi:hypothetical protein